MKFISFLVLLFAFLGNGKASAFINTVHVLSSLELAENFDVEISQTVEVKTRLGSEGSIVIFHSEKIRAKDHVFHSNFTINRLTFYFSSRLHS